MLRSDAHVLNVRSASVLAHHRFRHALIYFQAVSEAHSAPRRKSHFAPKTKLAYWVRGESWISTRRFCALPTSVAFEATGLVLPKPVTAKRR